eukprot:TRINITY_DN8103_c1_g1_i1.p1 TRINITY_DN8103_c1_g1~~TRINITY_DN8103_c1_g1_i1.p1  ORF type:complete len:736 (+),score=296.28 TRINITY_DN8103_c1_g1_i1:85-2292(+)
MGCGGSTRRGDGKKDKAAQKSTADRPQTYKETTEKEPPPPVRKVSFSGLKMAESRGSITQSPRSSPRAEGQKIQTSVAMLVREVCGELPRGRRTSVSMRRLQPSGSILSPASRGKQEANDMDVVRDRTMANSLLSEVLTQLAKRVGVVEVTSSLQKWEELYQGEDNRGEEEADEAEQRVAAPEATVAFVFTDIASSTALWEQVPEAMDEALSIHNRVMRRALRDAEGYEVKTIGDAFMVAFADTKNALRFCLMVQTDLNDQDWPEELQEVSAAAREEGAHGPIFAGLRVRMGLHVGEVIKEVNPITGRADYRGHTVNTAARVEGQGVGGQIFMTNDALANVEGTLAELGDPVIRTVGLRTLKGVAKPVELYACVPSHLSERLQKEKAAPPPTDKSEKDDRMSFHTQLFAGLGRQLGMRMRRAHGSLVLVRNDMWVDMVSSSPNEILDEQCDLIRNAAVDIVKTEGTMEAVQGDALLAAWNTTKACMAHTEQALRFAALLHSRRHPDISELGFGAAFGASPDVQTPHRHRRLFFGIAAGKVVQGTVGTARQRFRCVIGHTERLVSALADHCPMFGCLALAARGVKKPTGNESGIETHLRPVDIWQVGTEGDTVIEEVDVVSLSAAEREFGVWDFLADNTAMGMGGGEVAPTKQRLKQSRRTVLSKDFHDSFHSAIRGDGRGLEVLEKMLVGHDDKVLELLCGRLKAHISSGNASADRPSRYTLPCLVQFPEDKPEQ